MIDETLPRTLIEAVRYFSDLTVCNRYLRKIRWPDGKIVCPRCGATGERIGEIKTLGIPRCKDCRHKIYPYKGCEESFRFNNRTVGDGLRFQRAMEGVVGRRLTYRRLCQIDDAGRLVVWHRLRPVSRHPAPPD